MTIVEMTGCDTSKTPFRKRKKNKTVNHSKQQMNKQIEQDQQKQEQSYAKSLLTSSFAGVIGRSICYPMDTLRVSLQLQEERVNTFGQRRLVFSQTLGKIWRQEGTKALFNGFTVSVVGALPASALYLSSYDFFKQQLRTFDITSKFPDTTVILISGFLAEMISGFLWAPMEIVKGTMQASRQDTLASITKSIYLHDGMKGFWKGYSAQLAVFGPYTMCFFFAFENLEKMFERWRTPPYRLNIGQKTHPQHDYRSQFYSHHVVHSEPTSLASSLLLSSAISSAVAALLTSPLDVIKTRLQVIQKKKNEMIASFPQF